MPQATKRKKAECHPQRTHHKMVLWLPAYKNSRLLVQSDAHQALLSCKCHTAAAAAPGGVRHVLRRIARLLCSSGTRALTAHARRVALHMKINSAPHKNT